MTERLQKILSEAGICSRRKAEEYISAGRVYVNGMPAQLGEKADPETDIITFDGAPVIRCARRIVLMLNKPRGYVTTMSDPQNRKTAFSLVANCGERVFPVGRLDMDSEGLLLFTNDGELANRLLHPSAEVEKEYIVSVTGNLAAGKSVLEGRIILDGYTLAPASVKIRKESEQGGEFSIIIHEGRNRQIRRMCALAGLDVIRLKRIREGHLRLGDLKSGSWRCLTDSEIAGLIP